MENHVGTVCICGSMQFYDKIMEYATEWTLAGWIVLVPFKDPRGKGAIPPEDLEKYKKIHQERIKRSDAVLVVNPAGYIGNSVEEEIAYAESVGVSIHYTDPIEEPYIVTLCGSKKFIGEFDFQFRKLTKEGKVVFRPAMFDFNPEHLSKGEHTILDVVHQKKMKMSNEVLIINKDGYIGSDTRKEIEWCESHGINVTYLEDPKK